MDSNEYPHRGRTYFPSSGTDVSVKSIELFSVYEVERICFKCLIIQVYLKGCCILWRGRHNKNSLVWGKICVTIVANVQGVCQLFLIVFLK